MKSRFNPICRICVTMSNGSFIALATINGARADEPRQCAAATYQEIESTLGLVPGFLKVFQKAGIARGWAVFKSIQASEQTAPPPKFKSLIALAASAQVLCSYCVYFHTAAARAYGASDEAIKKTVALAAISRHRRTHLTGMAVDLPTVKCEFDASLQIAAAKAPKN